MSARSRLSAETSLALLRDVRRDAAGIGEINRSYARFGRELRAWLQSVECLLGAPDPGSAPIDEKIISGGSSGGRMPLAWASGGQPLLAAASVWAGQCLYGHYRDALVVHGREKVYGSIP
jgi:hypothetical protein